MCSPLTPDQRSLADAMAAISERGYSASWMDGLEFALWHLLATSKTQYGRAEVAESTKADLRRLSERCGGWILFGAAEQEEFVPMKDWLVRYAEWYRLNQKRAEDVDQ
jgi:hypothetical protein